MSIQQKLIFWESVVDDRIERDKICPKCGTKVYNSVLRLRGRDWHSKCFQCKNCARVLNLTTYTEVNNEIYCSECYAECFSRRWRCSEVINSRRLSKQLKNAVMDGQHYRWQPPKSIDDSDTLDSTSFHSASSEMPQVVPGDSRKTDDSIEGSTVDEADIHPSEPQPVRQRTHTHTRAERPVSALLNSPHISTTHRPMRQISRGRMFASEGIPERRFDPSELTSGKTEQTSGDEVKVVQVRLRDTPARVAACAGPVEIRDVGSQTKDERKYSEIYSIVETPEESEATDSVESQSESSSSEDTVPPVPPSKPPRLRNSLAVSAGSLLDAEKASDRMQRGPPRVRHASFHCIRHSRFPSDHLAGIPVVSQPDLRH